MQQDQQARPQMAARSVVLAPEVAHSVLWQVVYGTAVVFHYLASSLNFARPNVADLVPRRPAPWAPDDVRMVRMLTLKDKISFMLGVANLVFVAWALGAGPVWFYHVYSVEIVAVIGYRFYRYWRVKQHYYLLDFCYLANGMMLYYLWVDPSNYVLFQTLWVFAMGPLAWSVMTFRNSMVFHASDRMTSVAVHLLPSWMCWAVRWMAPPALGFRYCKDVQDTQGGPCHADLRDMYLWSALPYMLWLAFYYVFVFIVRSRRVDEQGYQTLFRWLMTTESIKSHPIRRLVASVSNPWLQRLVYMSIHLVFTIFTGMLAIFYWYSFGLNTAFLIAMFCHSIWNGGTYYMDYFSKQYRQILQRSIVHLPPPDPAVVGPASSPQVPPSGQHED